MNRPPIGHQPPINRSILSSLISSFSESVLSQNLTPKEAIRKLRIEYSQEKELIDDTIGRIAEILISTKCIDPFKAIEAEAEKELDHALIAAAAQVEEPLDLSPYKQWFNHAQESLEQVSNTLVLGQATLKNIQELKAQRDTWRKN